MDTSIATLGSTRKWIAYNKPLNISVVAVAEGNICEGQPDGKLFPDTTNCHKFIKCAHGKAYQQNCNAKLMYDSKKGYCDWASNVDCPGESLLKFSALRYDKIT